MTCPYYPSCPHCLDIGTLPAVEPTYYPPAPPPRAEVAAESAEWIGTDRHLEATLADETSIGLRRVGAEWRYEIWSPPQNTADGYLTCDLPTAQRVVLSIARALSEAR